MCKSTHTHTPFIHALGLIFIECNIHSIDLLTHTHSLSHAPENTHTHKHTLPSLPLAHTHTHTHTHNCLLLLTCFFTPCSFDDVNASRHVQCALTEEGGAGVCVWVCVCLSPRVQVGMCKRECAYVCVLTALKNQLTAHSSSRPPPPNEEVN